MEANEAISKMLFAAGRALIDERDRLGLTQPPGFAFHLHLVEMKDDQPTGTGMTMKIENTADLEGE